MKQKGRTTKVSSFGSSAISFFKRLAAFRPLLTEGLALSGKQLSKNYKVNLYVWVLDIILD
jgi:hypothetical protein